MVLGEKSEENASLSSALHLQCSVEVGGLLWDTWMEESVACSEDVHPECC